MKNPVSRLSILAAASFTFIACNAASEPALAQAEYSGAFAVLQTDIRGELISCGVDQPEFDRLLNLSQNKFDQDFEGGWRTIGYKDKCQNAAAEVIISYMLYSEPYPPESMGILRWHAGQTKAGAGKYEEAIALFKGTYKSDDDHGTPWNYYVDATIAFLENDQPALQRAHDELAKLTVSEDEKASRRKFLKDNPKISMPDGFVDNPQNLTTVTKLLNCFGKPYREAYGRCETE